MFTKIFNMKIRIILSFVLVSLLFSANANAQILKGFGRMIEKKVSEKIEKKAERNVDKVLDKADQKSDKPVDNMLNPSPTVTDKKLANTIDTKVNAQGDLTMIAKSCNDFIWFKEGSFIAFETRAMNEKLIQKSKMTVKRIRHEGGITIASVQASDDKGNDFEMEYKCIGDKMYMDLGAMMREAMKKAGQIGSNKEEMNKVFGKTEIGFTDGFMSFPKKMYVGQELDPVTISIKTSPTPQTTMEIIATQHNRKVVDKEKIVTPAGTFDCLKLSAQLSSSMKIMGMNRKLPTSTEHTWFAPNIGVVKQVNYNAKGKAESTTQLTSYKF